MELRDFLLARIAEDEAYARWRMEGRFAPIPDEMARPDTPARMLAECEAKRRIVAFHDSWPVLVESPPKFDPPPGCDIASMTLSMTLRMSQQMAWMTQQEYRARFGDEPPTAPMLAALAAVYADHPDFDPQWAV